MRTGSRSRMMPSGSPVRNPHPFTGSIPRPIKKLLSFLCRAIHVRAWHSALAVSGYRCAASQTRLRASIPNTNRISAILPIGPAGPEGGIAASRDSVWIVTDDAGTLVRIDPATNKVRQKISIAPGSYNPCFSRRHGVDHRRDRKHVDRRRCINGRRHWPQSRSARSQDS